MKIELHSIKVRNLYNGYISSDEDGVFAYDGKLNIRPPYQREFVYKDKQRDAVIDTITKHFPLNVMYWCKNGEDSYEVLDGQQRTLSICQYIHGDFAIDYRYYHNLTEDEQNVILDYELMIYVCEGSDSEKLSWFKTINIAGEKLTNQELLNAIYVGKWLMDAKKYFSKTQCVAYQMANKYISGVPIRQDYLETALDWISDGCGQQYMSEHQQDSNANDLWFYFNSVITWVKTLFPKTQKEMKSVNWGRLYNMYKDNTYDANELAKDVAILMADDDVTKKSGIFEYLLSGKTNEKVLSIRVFTDTQKQTQYAKQDGICPICGEHYEYEEMEGDHITPWIEGGKTIPSNLQMICKHCNRIKGAK